MGERTGSRVLQWVWSYVKVHAHEMVYIGMDKRLRILLMMSLMGAGFGANSVQIHRQLVLPSAMAVLSLRGLQPWHKVAETMGEATHRNGFLHSK
ncbi:hypothetical protein LY78DRAFT_493994 [Colletotrichum sublineola]|nr:hypothetical protein LY78DRAFT_493994 [Colletotrichum sublineola]